MFDTYALGTVGQPIRAFVENASRMTFVLAQLRPGEIAFRVTGGDRTRRIVTNADAGLQGPVLLPEAAR